MMMKSLCNRWEISSYDSGVLTPILRFFIYISQVEVSWNMSLYVRVPFGGQLYAYN